jgi:hypothetical protein
LESVSKDLAAASKTLETSNIAVVSPYQAA